MIDIQKTYCNPIPLPDYPIGRDCYDPKRIFRACYRETADPTVLYYEGKWYLYPSCGMVYWTEDFTVWHHQHMEPYDCGYAPTVVLHKGKFYLTAFGSELYVSDSPLGPFVSMGTFLDPSGEARFFPDPMLFSDDDERLYLYAGCGGGITGVELDSNNPRQLLSEPLSMFNMDTENHIWERMGDWNQDASYSWVEGSWMYKRNGIYYLTYAAPGTEMATYAMGAYKSKSPLGPWEYMKTSPFLSNRHGLVKAPGHGCLVDGPNGTVWAFYTCLVGYGGIFERRCGFDPIGFDENGDIIPTSSTEIPQWAPGCREKPFLGNDTGLIPLTQNARSQESSAVSGRDGIYALDDSMLTWWQPDPNDPNPTLTVDISDAGINISSMRIMWRDVGLDVLKGILPGAFQYKIEALSMEDEWVCVLDQSENKKDMLIDYLAVKPMRAKKVRLCICGHPENIEPGVINFTVFGYWTWPEK